eukprot:CAMPEP_0197174234 /NCGR_PEP_ID=MMETSP1423-20130617/846_1 /TAXON_ID=476441 /ORGANISM="Pseudo-nitzschia heimii, Strain UNC1101" /LENGTH=164 /DNA_ID=CAMNT_0042623143 /DNA_START=152 /DNA_END=646 /DNA_ORIENTATION=+
MTRIVVVLVPLAATVVIASMAEGFAPRATLGKTAAASSSSTPRRFIRPSTELCFGLPSFLNKNEEEEDEEVEEDPNLEKPTVGLKGLIQLVTAGAGAPFLGDYQGVDKETGNFMFSLEANNLVDEEGKSKQTSMPYFESGWVDPEDLKKEEENKKKKGGGFKLW